MGLLMVCEEVEKMDVLAYFSDSNQCSNEMLLLAKFNLPHDSSLANQEK
jgi:hypothetical protein